MFMEINWHVGFDVERGILLSKVDNITDLHRSVERSGEREVRSHSHFCKSRVLYPSDAHLPAYAVADLGS